MCTLCSNEAAYVEDQTTNKDQSMSVETTTYVRKPFEVEAVQVTEENMDAVSEWCNGNINPGNRPFIKVHVARALNDRQTKAYSGDWVLYAGTGFKVYTDKAFGKTFERKTEELLTIGQTTDE
jgi:hypothetical protein